jgi:iron complex transport system permease protein
MGVNLKTLKYSIFFSIALMVGAVTAIAGSVGFVGLAIPHILRPFLGEQPSKLLLPSLLGGALLVLLADIIVRIIPTSSELKLGVVTSLIGIPFFFKILLSGRRRYL